MIDVTADTRTKKTIMCHIKISEATRRIVAQLPDVRVIVHIGL